MRISIILLFLVSPRHRITRSSSSIQRISSPLGAVDYVTQLSRNGRYLVEISSLRLRKNVEIACIKVPQHPTGPLDCFSIEISCPHRPYRYRTDPRNLPMTPFFHQNAKKCNIYSMGLQISYHGSMGAMLACVKSGNFSTFQGYMVQE